MAKKKETKHGKKSLKVKLKGKTPKAHQSRTSKHTSSALHDPLMSNL